MILRKMLPKGKGGGGRRVLNRGEASIPWVWMRIGLAAAKLPLLARR
jgi:hypothetical protein